MSGATSQVGSTIFNGNRISNGGTTTSLGYNLSSDDGSGFFTATGDQINTDPMLGPLQDNGGPTFTHAPLQGSPAIDAVTRTLIQMLSIRRCSTISAVQVITVLPMVASMSAHSKFR